MNSGKSDRNRTAGIKPLNALMKGDFVDAAEPWAIFRAWMAEAEAAEPNDPSAMSLATVDQDGLPDVRMVLLKGADERGFVFYTNTESNKGRELAANPKRLAEMRARLAAVRLTTPLFDTALFTADIERAYLEMWRLHQSGEAPREIVIPASEKAAARA